MRRRSSRLKKMAAMCCGGAPDADTRATFPAACLPGTGGRLILHERRQRARSARHYLHLSGIVERRRALYRRARCRSLARRWRVRRHRRPDRLRQVDLAQCRRRACCRASKGSVQVFGEPLKAHQPPRRLYVSGRGAAALADRARQCRLRPGAARHAQARSGSARRFAGWSASASPASASAIRSSFRAA